jgi:hypothetical protein
MEEEDFEKVVQYFSTEPNPQLRHLLKDDKNEKLNHFDPKVSNFLCNILRDLMSPVPSTWAAYREDFPRRIGKTTAAIHLALTLQYMGYKVVFACCNNRTYDLLYKFAVFSKQIIRASPYKTNTDETAKTVTFSTGDHTDPESIIIIDSNEPISSKYTRKYTRARAIIMFDCEFTQPVDKKNKRRKKI